MKDMPSYSLPRVMTTNLINAEQSALQHAGVSH